MFLYTVSLIWLYIAEKLALIPPQSLTRVGRDAELRARLMGMRRREEAVMLTLLAEEERIRAERRRRRPRQMWVRPWLLRRPQYGQYERLMAELEREARGDFR